VLHFGILVACGLFYISNIIFFLRNCVIEKAGMDEVTNLEASFQAVGNRRRCGGLRGVRQRSSLKTDSALPAKTWPGILKGSRLCEISRLKTR